MALLKLNLIDTDLDDYFTTGITNIDTDQILSENINALTETTNKIFEIMPDLAQISSLIENNNSIVNTLNRDGISIAHIFTIIDYPEGYELLKHNGGDLNIKDKNGQSPLHHAVLLGKINCIKLLCDNGANINSQDNDGNTPLHIAVINNLYESVQILIEYSSNPFVKNIGDHTPYDYSFLNRIIHSQLMDYILGFSTL